MNMHVHVDDVLPDERNIETSSSKRRKISDSLVNCSEPTKESNLLLSSNGSRSTSLTCMDEAHETMRSADILNTELIARHDTTSNDGMESLLESSQIECPGIKEESKESKSNITIEKSIVTTNENIFGKLFVTDSVGENHELAGQAKSSANVNVVCDVYAEEKLKEPRNSPNGDKVSVKASTVSQPINKLSQDIGSKIDALHSVSESEAMKQNVSQFGNASPQILGSCTERSHFSGKKKLLVLDVNGLLVDIVADPDRGHRADTIVGSKAVFKRPYCDEFLQFCFERFNVGVWTSRTRRNIERVLDFLIQDTQHQLLFCWDQSHCTQTGLNTIENSDKPLVLKELKKLWEKQDPNLPWDRGEYNESNTVLLDDSPYKALRNPPYTAIFPYTFSYWNIKDNYLGPGGNLRNYLERLAASENVQKFVEQNPFGQRPITENNPHWGFYKKVISGTSSDIATSSAAKSFLDVNTNPSLEYVNNGLVKRTDTYSVRGAVEQRNNSLESRAVVDGGTNIKDIEQKDCLAGEGTEAGHESAEFQKEDNNTKLKVDKFGRTVRAGASDGGSDDLHHTEWPGNRGRSWIRSRSPHDRRWSPWRQREKRSQSHSWSPERSSRRSRSPHRHRDGAGADPTSRDNRHPAVCYRFQQGRCFRGLECRFSHDNNSDEPKKRSRSRSPHRHHGDGGEQTTRDNRPPAVCNRFQQGRCFRGLSCRFSHASNNSDESKKRSRSRSPHRHHDMDGGEQTTRDTRQPPACDRFQHGTCFRGWSCRFFHDSNNSDESKKRSRSRSPHRHDGKAGGDRTSQDTRHPPVCNNFQQGRCFRGASCWFVHDPDSSDEPKKRGRSRSPRRHDDKGGGDRTRHPQVCYNFQQGRCFRGASCWFIHDPDSSDEPKKRSRSRSPRRHDSKAGGDPTGRDRSHPPVCYDFLQGRCLRGMSCRYLHDSNNCEEPKTVSSSRQGRNAGGDWTKQDTRDKPICYDFRRGKCFRGELCRYIHDSNKSYESRLYENTERSKIPDKPTDDGHVEVNGQEIQLCQDVPGTSDGVMKAGDKFQDEILEVPETIGQAVISEKDGRSLVNEGRPAMSLAVTSQVQVTQDITEEFVESVAARVTDNDRTKLLDVRNMPDQQLEAKLSDPSTANSDEQPWPKNGSSSSDHVIAQTSSIPPHLSIGERQAPLSSQHSQLLVPPASSCNSLQPPPPAEPGKTNSHSQLSVPPASSCSPLPPSPPPAGRMQFASDLNLPPCELSSSENQPPTFEEPGKTNSHSQLSVPPASSCNPLPPSPPPPAGRMQPFSDQNLPQGGLLVSTSESQPHLPQNSMQNPIADSSSTFEEPGKTNSRYASDSPDLHQPCDISGLIISSDPNPSPSTSDQPPSTKFNSVVLSPDKRSSNGNPLTSENHIHIDGQNLSTPRSRNLNSSPLTHSFRKSNNDTKNKVTDNSDVLLLTNVSNQHLNLVENNNLILLADVAVASKENEPIE